MKAQSETSPFGQRLIDLRCAAGLSQEDVEVRVLEQFGVSGGVIRASVCQWERAMRVPTPWQLRALFLIYDAPDDAQLQLLEMAQEEAPDDYRWLFWVRDEAKLVAFHQEASLQIQRPPRRRAWQAQFGSRHAVA
jgi:transcriptional regulator with XRE-family HTH domain